MPGVEPIWDGITLLVCSVALYFVFELYLSFKGGVYGKAYTFYVGAAFVLSIAFVAKLILDFMGIQPEDFGISLRDTAIILALVLFALGLRKTKEFWSPPKPPESTPLTKKIRSPDTESES